MIKKCNVLLQTGEVDIVALHVKTLTEAGVQAKDIAVIAPYNLQVGNACAEIVLFIEHANMFSCYNIH